MGRRIVVNAFGSAGDLNPFFAIARRLRARGHHIVVVTDECSRAQVKAAGFEFKLSRRAFSYGLEEPHEMPLFNIRNSYSDLIANLRDADLLISHQVAFAAPLAAERSGVPWVSVLLSPFMFGSAYQEQVSPHGPAISPAVMQLSLAQLNYLHQASAIYTEQVNSFRRELGLAPAGDVLLSDNHSPRLVLALFSPTLAKRKPEWPAQTCVTGFTFADRSSEDLSPKLQRFLDQGSPPVVFTLGSASVFDTGSFRVASAGAARLLGRRAILLGQVTSGYTFPNDNDLISVDYAPHGPLLTRAAAVVHHGGIGTLAAAMRAGCPMLVVPGFAWDQPDNAARAVGLGIARALTLTEYSAASAARELRQLLSDPSYANNSARVRKKLEKENGVESAVDAIERYLETI